LDLGVVDAFEAVGLSIFGPQQAAAQLEASKAFAKNFMRQHQIPTPAYATFTNYDKAVAFVDSLESDELVVKISGLGSKGQGVSVCDDHEQAHPCFQQTLTFGFSRYPCFRDEHFRVAVYFSACLNTLIERMGFQWPGRPATHNPSCCGGLASINRAYVSGVSLISTRRFRARPASVVFGATGSVSPAQPKEMASAGSVSEFWKYSATWPARSRDSPWLSP